MVSNDPAEATNPLTITISATLDNYPLVKAIRDTFTIEVINNSTKFNLEPILRNAPVSDTPIEPVYHAFFGKPSLFIFNFTNPLSLKIREGVTVAENYVPIGLEIKVVDNELSNLIE